jgi:hypothetical protein
MAQQRMDGWVGLRVSKVLGSTNSKSFTAACLRASGLVCQPEALMDAALLKIAFVEARTFAFAV